MQNTEKCESCGSENQPYALVNGSLICGICQQPMVKEGIPLNAPEVLPEAIVAPKTAIVEPSVASMQENITTLEKAISELEKKRDKIISEKHSLLTNDGDYHIIEGLHSKEKSIIAELTKLSSELQTSKQSLNWKLADRENLALAQSGIAKYEIKLDEALQAGQNLLSMAEKFNQDIVLLGGDAKQFNAIQARRYDESFALLRDLRVMGLINILSEKSGVQYGADNIRCDTSPEMRNFKKALKQEMVKVINNLLTVESIIWDIERALNFEQFNSVIKPDNLPNY
ncbi:MAG: hypothetical protein WA277_09880 [Nitrospirota bacterium]